VTEKPVTGNKNVTVVCHS